MPCARNVMSWVHALRKECHVSPPPVYVHIYTYIHICIYTYVYLTHGQTFFSFQLHLSVFPATTVYPCRHRGCPLLSFSAPLAMLSASFLLPLRMLPVIATDFRCLPPFPCPTSVGCICCPSFYGLGTSARLTWTADVDHQGHMCSTLEESFVRVKQVV